MLLPPRIRFSDKCKRCGLRYPHNGKSCVHWDALTDEEVESMLERNKKEHKTSANIGNLLLYLAALIIAGIAILSL